LDLGNCSNKKTHLNCFRNVNRQFLDGGIVVPTRLSYQLNHHIKTSWKCRITIEPLFYKCTAFVFFPQNDPNNDKQQSDALQHLIFKTAQSDDLDLEKTFTHKIRLSLVSCLGRVL